MAYPNKERQKIPELTKTNYVTVAENVLKEINQERDQNRYYKVITTSQIRSILELVNPVREQIRIQTQKERLSKLNEDMINQVQYIKLRLVYAAGRDNDSKGVREFIQKAGLLRYIDSIGESVSQYLLFCQYVEALTAYHKYYIGK